MPVEVERLEDCVSLMFVDGEHYKKRCQEHGPKTENPHTWHHEETHDYACGARTRVSSSQRLAMMWFEKGCVGRWNLEEGGMSSV